jgi:PAS domain S-box-containing protein
MTEISHPEGAADRQARWQAMWREAVRESRLTLGLVELSTSRIIELSPLAAELLGTTPEEGSGLSALSVIERPRGVAETFRLVREGMVDGVRAHRRCLQRNGSTVEVEWSGWAIRSPVGPDLGLWAARVAPSEPDRSSVVEQAVTESHPRFARSVPVGARITLNDHWRVAHVSTRAGSLLGRPPADWHAASFLEVTHPDDVVALLFAFARATTDTAVGVQVRLRHRDGSWCSSRAAPAVLDGDGTSPFELVLAVDEPLEPSESSGEVRKLAGQLRRIAAQIEAEVVLVEPADPLGAPLMPELSSRQWEIVTRLVRGCRVPTIAEELYLSQSTVRNHLSAIFRKVGVHSQQEFLAFWHGGVGRPSA